MVKLKLSKLVLLTGLTYFLSSYSIAASERGSLRNILKSTPLAISTNMIYDAALVPNLGATIGMGGGEYTEHQLDARVVEQFISLPLLAHIWRRH